MQDLEFEWDEDNELKLWQRHRVTSDEAEEVFFNRNFVRFSRWASTPRGDEEQRFLVLGSTDAGRRLLVVFVNKERKKKGRRIRILSARNMTPREASSYKKECKE